MPRRRTRILSQAARADDEDRARDRRRRDDRRDSGKKSPVLITADMVKAMPPGSVIVDLAAERGGNCELTKADERVVAHDVTILGPTNLTSTVPYHASQMYARNVVTLVQHLVRREKGADGKATGAPTLVIDVNDENHEGDSRDPRRTGDSRACLTGCCRTRANRP